MIDFDSATIKSDAERDDTAAISSVKVSALNTIGTAALATLVTVICVAIKSMGAPWRL